MVAERAREANRIQKVLEGANVKLAAVVSNVLGVSGRAMLSALASGTTEPHELAALATARLTASPEQLAAALEGQVGPHQRHLLAAQLRHIAFLDGEVARLDAEIEARLRPFDDALLRTPSNGSIPFPA